MSSLGSLCADIMSRRDKIETHFQSSLKKNPKLNFFVAHNIRIRRVTCGIFQHHIYAPCTSYLSSFSNAAATEESTPPDIAINTLLFSLWLDIIDSYL